MPDWKERFVMACREMIEEGTPSRNLPDQGSIEKRLEEECKSCRQKGIFDGIDLDCGEFYECALAEYCPRCENTEVITTERNFPPDLFLPLMKKKLIYNLEFLPKVREAEPCPTCRKPTYQFEKDLGSTDYYYNTWRACLNPFCRWPGEHKEKYESSFSW